MLFFAKVRIDLSKLIDLGQKLQSGELDLSSVKSTHCIKDDPSVGLNIWEADNREDFDRKFAPHRKYYSEVIEVTPVIEVEEAQKILMQHAVGK